MIKQEKFERAKGPLERALKYASSLAIAHGYLGMVFFKLGKPEKLEEHRQALLALRADCGNCENRMKIEAALKLINDLGLSQALSTE